MNNAAGVLPNLEGLNPGELQELLLALHEQVFSHRKQIATQQQEILSQREQLASRDTEIENLKLLIAKLRRMQFGRSSEKLHRQIEQLELRLGDLEQTRAIETELRKVVVAESVATRPARRPLPAHLRREVPTYLPKQNACPDCGGELKHLGEDVSEILEYVPERVKVIRQVRPKLACTGCDESCKPRA